MSFTMHGTGVSAGIAIGYAHIVSTVSLEVAHYVLPAAGLPAEIERFDRAVSTAREAMLALREHIPPDAPAEFAGFLDLHLMILNDSTLSTVPRTLIETSQCNAEWALKQQTDKLVEQFDRIDDPYLRERKADVIQVAERIMKVLLGHPSHAPMSASPEQSRILVAHDLSPADMIQFKSHQFAAFITDVGGATSHTAIVARSLNIPSVMALHHARQMIREDELLVVDGAQGVIIVNPDKQVLAEYRLRQTQLELERQKLKRLRTARATTLDGTTVELLANIELPQDIDRVKETGASGIGLFRTEFLFLNRKDLPGEEEQFEAYRKVAEAMRSKPVTVRTLDLGADKHLNGAQMAGANPALGLRAIRLCLAEPQMFHIQLRAILRASYYGKIRLLLPMLSSLPELHASLTLLESAKQTLRAQDIPFDPDIEIGGMIETPAAAVLAASFAKRLNFLSIGTNDLIQYTLAIDRSDDHVAHLYDPLHPAILQLVAYIIKTAHKANVPVSVCGEMAGDAGLTRMLLGFGLRMFSMHPAHLLAVKQQVLKANLPEVTAGAQRMLKAEEPDKVRAALARLNA